VKPAWYIVILAWFALLMCWIFLFRAWLAVFRDRKDKRKNDSLVK